MFAFAQTLTKAHVYGLVKSFERRADENSHVFLSTPRYQIRRFAGTPALHTLIAPTALRDFQIFSRKGYLRNHDALTAITPPEFLIPHVASASTTDCDLRRRDADGKLQTMEWVSGLRIWVDDHNRRQYIMGNDAESVSILLQQLKHGDEDASGEIWKRYINRLVPLARHKLAGLRSAVVDEEDILVSVFDRFFKAAEGEQFARLNDRHDLWQVLLLLTERRVADQYRKSHAQKRGGGNVAGLADVNPNDSMAADNLMELADKGPTPEFAASFADQLEVAMERIQESTTREVAIFRMEGYGTKEIAEKLQISLSSVERKLRMIRSIWEELDESAS